MTNEMVKPLLFSLEKKNLGLAYVLLIIFGGLGIHRFYLGHAKMGAAILVTSILTAVLWGIALSPLHFAAMAVGGFLCLLCNACIILSDVFRLPGLVKKHNLYLLKTLELS